MEAVRRLTWRFCWAAPVLLLASGGVTVKTQTPSESDSGSSEIPVTKNCTTESPSSQEPPQEKKYYFRFRSMAAATESPSSQEPQQDLFWMRKPNIVKAGDPVLHERACEVDLRDIKSERVQKIIDYMIQIMRDGSATSLSAPQIGIPSRIIVLEYKKEMVSKHTVENANMLDRRPFDLLVIVNPELKKESNETALAFESCVSVDGYGAVVERNLDVKVTGFDRYGEPLQINASGWQARILQHECDHLDGILYVEKMVPRTFRTNKNFNMPLVHGCPRLGPRG